MSKFSKNSFSQAFKLSLFLSLTAALNPVMPADAGKDPALQEESPPTSQVTQSHRYKDLIQMGPHIIPIDQGEDSVVPVAEFQRIKIPSGATQVEVHFFRARNHHFKSMMHLGVQSQKEGDFQEAFNWYLLALGCKFVSEPQIGLTDPIYLFLKNLSKEIGKTLPQKTKGNRKKKKSESSGTKAKRKLVRYINQIVAKSPSPTASFTPSDILRKTGGVVPNHIHITEFIGYLASFAKDNYYEFIGFTQLASNAPDTLAYLASGLRYLKGVTRTTESLLFELEKKYLLKLNSATIYYGYGVRLFKLGRDRNLHIPLDRFLSQTECYERAAYYFDLSAIPNALYALGTMYKTGKLGKDLSTEARLNLLEEIFGKVADAECYGQLGQAFLKASRTPGIEQAVKDSYLKKAEAYLKPANALLDLGATYADMGYYDKAKDMWLRGNTPYSLSNLAQLYYDGSLGRDLAPSERFGFAKKYLEQALAGPKKPAIALFNLGLLYSQGQLDPKLGETDHLQKGIELLMMSLTSKDDGGKANAGKALRNIALNYMLLDNYSEAEKYALKARAAGVMMDDVFARIQFTQEEGSSSDEEGVGPSLVDLEVEPEKSLESPAESSPKTHPEDHLPSPISKTPPSPKKQAPKRTKAEKKRAQMMRNREKVKELIAQETFVFVSSQQKADLEWALANGDDVLKNRKGRSKVKELFSDILHEPWGLTGTGDAEILKHYHRQYGVVVYSRRITLEDRLTYILDPVSHQVHFLTWKGHYTGLNREVERYLEERND